MTTAAASLYATLLRGFRGKCPSCGTGRLFRAFLKVDESCPACGEELHHHRADDFPAYLVIMIVGHILVPLVLWVEQVYAPDLVTHLMLWMPLCVAMTLGLLQPVKGTIVALQWHAGMHGFAAARKARALGS